MRLLIAVCVAILVAAVAPASSANKPALRVVGTKPLTVSGTNFRAFERVTVAAVTRRKHVRKVTANARGRFKLRFTAVHVGRCPDYMISAKGARGSRARLGVRSVCPPIAQ